MPYYAEVNAGGDVLRVIVAPDANWPPTNLGGTWIETRDPYRDYPDEIPEYDEDGNQIGTVPNPDPLKVVNYTGIGQHHDPGVTERFTGDEWDNDKATTPDPDDGSFFYSTQGMLTWYDPGDGARMWRNLLPDGNPNTFPPPTNWREYPLDPNGVPVWQQPTGAFDAYPVGFVVSHNDGVWESLIPANTTEPGTDPRWWAAVPPA